MTAEHTIPKTYDPASVEKNGISIGRKTTCSMRNRNRLKSRLRS